MVNRGWVQSIQNVDNLCAKTEGGLKETKLADKRKYYFPFSDFYGILRKTFNITRSRNAQGRFWIRQRDDPSQGVVFVYCVADYDHLFRLFKSSPDGYIHHQMMKTSRTAKKYFFDFCKFSPKINKIFLKIRVFSLIMDLVT